MTQKFEITAPFKIGQTVFLLIQGKIRKGSIVNITGTFDVMYEKTQFWFDVKYKTSGGQNEDSFPATVLFKTEEELIKFMKED